MVVASKMGDCHIDLYWIDLQLCHEDEHIHCNLEGNFEEEMNFCQTRGFETPKNNLQIAGYFL